MFRGSDDIVTTNEGQMAQWSSTEAKFLNLALCPAGQAFLTCLCSSSRGK